MAAYAHCRRLWLPKAGRSADEYEDAFWPTAEGAYALEQETRFAVADGATESSFARRWARHLVLAYCNPLTPPPADAAGFRQEIERRGARWMRYVYAKPLAWNFLAKAQRGAHATLTGVAFMPYEGTTGRWDALAVGDTCLFQVRDGQLVRAFPVQEAEAFGYHPQLLCSVSRANEQVWAEWDQRLTHGEWAAGDLFLLMTDALAKWFVERVEEGVRPWETLLEEALSSERFQEWVACTRTKAAMQNDDVTLMLITIEESA
jgi:hypothetical protein